MRLGVSNLAWDPAVDDRAFTLIRSYGAEGVEVAPTRLGAWENLSVDVLTAYREKLSSAGMCVSSLQAILFNKPDAKLLGDTEAFDALSTHIQRIGSIASTLDAKIAVFGAPSSRARGELSVDDATDLAIARMRRLGDIAAQTGLIIAIESVPEYYNCDFLTRVEDVAAFVRACDHPHIATHFDIACVTLAGDDPAGKLKTLNGKFAHFHAAEPDLGDFAKPRCAHKAAAAMLKLEDYSGWIVIEMRQLGGNGLAELESALIAVREAYF